MWSYFLLRHPFLPVEVVHNASSKRVFENVTPAPPYQHGQILELIHEGFLTYDRGLPEMLMLIKLLNDAAPGKVRLTIVGVPRASEAEFIKEKIEEYNLDPNCIRETGWINYDQLGHVNAKGHVGLIMMHPYPNNMFSTSNKLFNYIFSGLAVIVPDYAGTAYLVRKWRAGAIIRPQNVNDYANVILRWLEHPEELNQFRNNARQAALNEYNWECMETRLFEFYNRLLN
jgi:glycosyltransferase involved in cell wall biosynthesis